MDLFEIHYIALSLCLVFLIAQVLVKEKQISHILFAAFCGSIAMTITRKITGESIGNYQYLIGVGACATCNCYWLLARSLFRGKNSIALHHILFASAIALLIMIKQGYLFADNTELFSKSTSSLVQVILSELTILLSSCVLGLSFWEACRGFKTASKQSKNLRILFLCTFGGAVAISKISQGMLVNSPEAQEIITALIIMLVLINTQLMMFMRFRTTKTHSPPLSAGVSSLCKKAPEDKVQIESDSDSANSDYELASQVRELIIDQSFYLQPNLKVADIARELDVPEYRVSKALRNELSARNFNQFVNQLRISHAQNLLADPSKKGWSVLVVGLESGFATVGPFARAFKSLTGSTPNQYRQLQLGNI